MDEEIYLLETDTGLSISVPESQVDKWLETQSDDPEVIATKLAALEEDLY